MIGGVDFYRGDPNIKMNNEVVENAICALDTAGESYAGYAIDFGVLSTGETALVEMNDGFSLGAYNIGPKVYMDLIIARWEELLSTKTPSSIP